MKRRYRWDEELKELVEVGADWQNAPRRAQTATEQLTYGGLSATDGTDVSSRKKHREYMRKNNLTTVDDYAETWKRGAQERAEFYQGDWDRKGRREAIERAWYQKYKP